MAETGSTKLTLAEVAERAGVSRSLASLALRGEPGVQSEKRARILKIAAELNYTPHPAARSLASNQAGTIGILVADIVNPYLAVFAKTIDAAARAENFDVILSVDGATEESAEKAVSILLSQRVAGLIFIGAPASMELVEHVARRVPVVYVGRHIANEFVNSVSNDDRLGASLVVRHLVECGHKHIAHIDGGSGAGAQQRREGFAATMVEFSLKPVLFPGRYTLDGGLEGAHAALSAHPRPTAIFAANDLSAIGVLNCILKAGLAIPDDVAVVGYDDMPFAGSETMSLTTIRQPVDHMASQCIRSLIGRIQTPEEPGMRVLVAPTLIARRSTLGDRYTVEPARRVELHKRAKRAVLRQPD
jgi:DNA-binding LacI/PurR family transcriptional regulator